MPAKIWPHDDASMPGVVTLALFVVGVDEELVRQQQQLCRRCFRWVDVARLPGRDNVICCECGCVQISPLGLRHHRKIRPKKKN